MKNLPTILAHDGLWCDAERLAKRIDVTGIAHQHIKDRRARKRVALAAGGTLADYVPFYFGPRSPMLYAIHQGKVSGYEGGQQRVLHLVSSVEKAVGSRTPWCFTDGHAEMGPTLFFDDWSHRDEVDWALMSAVWWNDTREYPDRKRRRQAEFLVHKFFPWEAIEAIGTYDNNGAREVEAILESAHRRPIIRPEPRWYYQG